MSPESIHYTASGYRRKRQTQRSSAPPPEWPPLAPVSPPPRPVVLLIALKVALTDTFPVAVSLQAGCVPVQAPDQPANELLAPSDADNVMGTPIEIGSVQDAVQLAPTVPQDSDTMPKSATRRGWMYPNSSGSLRKVRYARPRSSS